MGAKAVNTYIYIHTHVYTYVNVCVCIYICICIYVYMHTYIQTDRQADSLACNGKAEGLVDFRVWDSRL